MHDELYGIFIEKYGDERNDKKHERLQRRGRRNPLSTTPSSEGTTRGRLKRGLPWGLETKVNITQIKTIGLSLRVPIILSLG